MTQKAVLKFCDCETTGLIDKMPEAEITEIAIVSWCEGDVTVDLHEKVKPKNTKPDARFNKSYDEKEWRTADVWDAAASEAVADILKGYYICGSNPDFDKRMITAECHRVGAKPPDWHHRGINTSTLGFPLYLAGEVEQTGLEHLARYFGIEHAAHTALGDCMAAIKVWEAFWEMYMYRPKMMKNALLELKHMLDKGEVYTQQGHAHDVINRGLVGE